MLKLNFLGNNTLFKFKQKMTGKVGAASTKMLK